MNVVNCGERVDNVIHGREARGNTVTQDDYLQDCFDCCDPYTPEVVCQKLAWTPAQSKMITAPDIENVETFKLEAFEQAVILDQPHRFTRSHPIHKSHRPTS